MTQASGDLEAAISECDALVAHFRQAASDGPDTAPTSADEVAPVQPRTRRQRRMASEAARFLAYSSRLFAELASSFRVPARYYRVVLLGGEWEPFWNARGYVIRVSAPRVFACVFADSSVPLPPFYVR